MTAVKRFHAVLNHPFIEQEALLSVQDDTVIKKKTGDSLNYQIQCAKATQRASLICF